MSARETAPAGGGATRWAAWLALALVLALWAPLFLCQPLWQDVTQYDVTAQELLRGSVLYRDVTDTNFPGVVLIHAAVRYVAGFRSEALRAFDGSRERAAEALDISPTTLWRKMTRLGITYEDR